MDADSWSAIAAWYAAGLSTITAAATAVWEIHKHRTSGPRLDAWVGAYLNMPSAGYLTAGVEVINLSDSPIKLDAFTLLDSDCMGYLLFVADPFGEEPSIVLGPRTRTQIGLRRVGDPGRNDDAKPGANPVISFRTSFSRDPVVLPIPETWVTMSREAEARAARRRKAAGT